MGSENKNVFKTNGREQIRKNYNKMSRFYDYFAGIFEENCIKKGLGHLHLKKGETVRDIGFGTGIGLEKIARHIGEHGKAYGIDISPGMRDQAKKRLRKYGLDDHVELHLGDAVTLPWESNKIDAVFMSFTLELFDTSEIPLVLSEARRVVKYGGRLGVVSLSKDYGQTIPMGIYEWFIKNFPDILAGRYMLKNRLKMPVLKFTILSSTDFSDYQWVFVLAKRLLPEIKT